MLKGDEIIIGMVRFQHGKNVAVDYRLSADLMAQYYQPLFGQGPGQPETNARIVFYQPPDQLAQVGLPPYVPEWAADPESGYHVLDPNQRAPNLGSDEDERYLVETLRQRRILRIGDRVPNHVYVEWETLQALKRGEEPPVPSANVYCRDPVLCRTVLDLDHRFLDEDKLVKVVETESNWTLTHERAFQQVQAGEIHGFRVDALDHMEGPGTYLQFVAERLPKLSGRPLVWVEKIGRIPRQWAGIVRGGMGHEWLNLSRKMPVPPEAEELVTKTYRQASKDDRTYAQVLEQARLEAASERQQREAQRLTETLNENDLTSHIAPSFAALEKDYRTYCDGTVPHACGEVIRRAMASNKLYARLGRIILGTEPGTAEQQQRYRKARAQWQQFTAQNYVLGGENVAFFRYLLSIAFGEVGGNPGQFSVSHREVHDRNRWTQANLPDDGVGIAHHDCKLGWFTAALILAILEFYEEYCEVLWPLWRKRYQALLEDGSEDGRAGRTLWQLLQVLIGAGLGVKPLPWKPVEGYLLKALCEAGMETHWCRRNEAWENRVISCAKLMYGVDCQSGSLTSDPQFMNFVSRVHKVARRNALRQWLLTLTVPGVPILFQGDEVWLQYFVDPGTRQRQDWPGRRALLQRVLRGENDNEINRMVMMRRIFSIRNELPELFGPDSTYEPLDEGKAFAFSRTHGGKRLLVVAGKKHSRGNILHDFEDVSVCLEQL